MMQLEAKTFATGADLIASYSAVRKRLQGRPRRPTVCAVDLMRRAPANDIIPERDEPKAHVEAWNAWCLVEESRHDPEAYVRARCAQLGISFTEMRSATRRLGVTGPRQILMFEVCWLFPSLSFPKVARIFNKDHTTVCHALTKVCAERGVDIALFRKLKASAQDKRIEEAKRLYISGATYAVIRASVGFSAITIARMVKTYGWKAEALRTREAA
ncbi:helix-turn-helix domain-containing protein [Rhizobium rhizogenes]|uniref:helix-turn-helix domain-containing protein n=1 Tax=Rhizobium rhizogenes TaxID=359 RepID=UPI0024BDC5FB|nr:helix-turn-helix domain-containing protein [Rhizobium rhizogenes]MDJ1632269.1 helix-turn-helix domain-containing protein [Rhizobium rhizogenes]